MASRSNFVVTRSSACLKLSGAMWSCKSFLHVCGDVPSISDALLATSYPNTQIEFRPPLRMLRIVRVSCSREDKHPQHHLANDLGVHVARVGSGMILFFSHDATGCVSRPRYLRANGLCDESPKFSKPVA